MAMDHIITDYAAFWKTGLFSFQSAPVSYSAFNGT